MAISGETLQALLKEISSTFSNLRNIDFKNLSLKDVVVLIGTAYSISKTLYGLLSFYRAVKQYGVARMLKPNFRKYGAWAVVTGCTHGIGRAYAVELAQAGVNIILVSRTQEKLNELAAFLTKTYEIQTHCICVDFNEGREVYEAITAGIEGKEVGILVNNVGVMYDFPQYFSEVSEDKLWQLINVNIAATTMLTHMIIPQMADRKRGAVVIVTSGTSFLPTPLATVYSASKNYLDFFARALRYEYKPKGVTIQVLQPLFVSGGNADLNTSTLVPSVESYTSQAVCTLGWSDTTSGCLSHTMQAWLAGFCPESTMVWITMMMDTLARQKVVKVA